MELMTHTDIYMHELTTSSNLFSVVTQQSEAHDVLCSGQHTAQLLGF